MTALSQTQSQVRIRFSAPRLIALSAYWLAINYLWQGMGALILPRLIVGTVASGHRGTALAVISAGGAILAILVQPAAGALSDRCRLPWGRRRPFMLAGTLGDIACLFGLSIAGSYAALLIPYFALQICSNTAEGAYQGLLPDQVPSHERGRAAGYYGIAVFTGTAIGFLLTGQLIAVGHIRLALLSVVVVLAAGAGRDPQVRARFAGPGAPHAQTYGPAGSLQLPAQGEPRLHLAAGLPAPGPDGHHRTHRLRTSLHQGDLLPGLRQHDRQPSFRGHLDPSGSGGCWLPSWSPFLRPGSPSGWAAGPWCGRRPGWGRQEPCC